MERYDRKRCSRISRRNGNWRYRKGIVGFRYGSWCGICHNRDSNVLVGWIGKRYRCRGCAGKFIYVQRIYREVCFWSKIRFSNRIHKGCCFSKRCIGWVSKSYRHWSIRTKQVVMNDCEWNGCSELPCWNSDCSCGKWEVYSIKRSWGRHGIGDSSCCSCCRRKTHNDIVRRCGFRSRCRCDIKLNCRKDICFNNGKGVCIRSTHRRIGWRRKRYNRGLIYSKHMVRDWLNRECGWCCSCRNGKRSFGFRYIVNRTYGSSRNGIADGSINGRNLRKNSG